MGDSYVKDLWLAMRNGQGEYKDYVRWSSVKKIRFSDEYADDEKIPVQKLGGDSDD